jgi:hypothetical protein
LLGAITPKQALKVPDHNRDSVRAQEIMVSKDKLIVMMSSRSADEALRRIFREKIAGYLSVRRMKRENGQES